MKVRCEYCNSLIDDSDEVCPGCNSQNKNYKQVANEVPTTIDELKEWYEARGLPPYETTRFFIGIDYKEPKAFGIYRDENTGKFIVYKNKASGERAIRYEGKDEKYAVNELYLKIKEEIAMRKNKNSSKSKKTGVNFLTVILTIYMVLVMTVIVIGFVSSIIGAGRTPSDGYYTINGNTYYNHQGDWYIYRNNRWTITSEPSNIDQIDDYYDGNTHSYSDDYPDIKDSDYYDSSWERSSWSNDSSWDSDSDWDSGSSWDSGGSDWDSDW